AADIYVGKNGRNKLRDGSMESPYSSLEDAIRHARELRRLNDPSISEGINIWIKEGIYFPEQAIQLRPEDSGTATSPTRIRPLDGKVVFSGGRRVTGWSRLGKHRDLPLAIARHIYVRSEEHTSELQSRENI